MNYYDEREQQFTEFELNEKATSNKRHTITLSH